MFLDILHLDISEYGSNFIQTLSNGTIKNVAKSYFDRKTEISWSNLCRSNIMVWKLWKFLFKTKSVLPI